MLTICINFLWLLLYISTNLVALNNRIFLPYSSVGHKSHMDSPKSRCWQLCVPPWMLQRRILFFLSFLASSDLLLSLAHDMVLCLQSQWWQASPSLFSHTFSLQGEAYLPPTVMFSCFQNTRLVLLLLHLFWVLL